MKEEFNLSEKRKTSNSYDDDEKDIISFDDLEYGVYLEKDVKEFIKRQISKIDKRIEFLSQFDGLAEVILQKAELKEVRRCLVEDAGDKLI